MDWHYSINGAQLGPIAEGELQSKILAGEVPRHALVWREGLPNWITVEQSGAFQLATALPADALAPARPGPFQSGGLGADPSAGTGGSSGKGIASMICGILGLLLSCCLFLGIPLGIAAAVLGHLQLADCKKTSSASGKGFALAGLVTGYLAIVGAILMIVLHALGTTLGPANWAP